MRLVAKIALGVLVAFALIQVVRVDRTNPPVTADVKAPPAVEAVLRRACYDCHSNETVWPWYSHVAPVSWLLHSDVTEGREDLNFSDWGAMTPERRAKKLQEIRKEVAEGDMPPWYYVPLHPPARLSPGDKALIEDWAAGAP